MKLQQLRYLTTIIEAGSMTEAARMLNITQPALSAGVAALEAELGGALLDRKRGTLRLTRLGARFYSRAFAIINECEAAKVEFRRGLKSSSVNIGVLPTISMPTVLRFLRRMSDLLPDVELITLEADAEKLASWLSSGRIDAALTVSKSNAEDGWTPLFRETIALMCAPDHRLAGSASVRFMDFDGEPFILRTQCEFACEAAEILDARGIRPRVVLRTSQDYRAIEAVKARIGVTIAPKTLGDGVSIIPIEDLSLKRTIGVRVAEGLDANLGSVLISTLKWATSQPADPDSP